MKAAIIIPARLESTRLAEKLLLAETGMPLICHTALAAARIRDLSDGMFSDIAVAADSERIIEAVEKFDRERGLGVRAVMTRTDHTSGSDRIAEAASGLGPEIDAVLNLQGDEPEIEPGAVLGLARAYAAGGADIATLAFPVLSRDERENPNLVKVVLGAGGRALYFSRADIPYRRDEGDFTPPAYGHVGIYLYRRDALERFVSLPPGRLERTEKLEQLRALENGMRIAVEVLDDSPPKGIDDAQDYREFVSRWKAGPLQDFVERMRWRREGSSGDN